jgi:hypothetical protein
MKSEDFWLVLGLVNAASAGINVHMESYGFATFSAFLALWGIGTAILYRGLEGLRGRDGAPGVPGPMGPNGRDCECKCGPSKQKLFG